MDEPLLNTIYSAMRNPVGTIAVYFTEIKTKFATSLNTRYQIKEKLRFTDRALSHFGHFPTDDLQQFYSSCSNDGQRPTYEQTTQLLFTESRQHHTIMGQQMRVSRPYATQVSGLP